jgi:hypothetical protein
MSDPSGHQDEAEDPTPADVPAGEVIRDRVDDPADPDPVDEQEPSTFGAPPTAVIADAARAGTEPAARDE